MSHFEEYRNRFPNISIERSDAVLTMRVHSDGGSLKWGALESSIQAQLGKAFFDVGHDRDNRIVIFTGTGDRFCTEGDIAEYPTLNAESWSRLMHEGRDLLMNLLNIEVPVIGVINGPAAIHAELPALGDIVLAADDAYIQDAAHIPAGVMPGDGVHAIWMEMLGPNRGRHFLLSGRKLGATELLAAGIVAEVLPRERLLARATELAQQLASLPPVTMRNTRLLVTQQLKRLLLNELGHGLALQGLSIYALIEQTDAANPTTWRSAPGKSSANFRNPAG